MTNDELRDQARKAETGGGHYVEQPGAITLNLGAMTDDQWRVFLVERLARVEGEVTRVGEQTARNTDTLRQWCGNGEPGINERLRDTVAKMNDAIAERKADVASIRFSTSRLVWAVALSDVFFAVVLGLHLSGVI